MSFIGFLFLIFFLYLLWGVIKVAWRIHRLRRHPEEMFNQMFGQAFGQARPGNAGPGHTDSGRKPGWSAAPQRAKRFDKSDGEYVKFDEITVTETVTETTDGADGTTSTRVTGSTTRIEDVEWEDVV